MRDFIKDYREGRKEGNGVNQANANQEKADTFKLPLEKADKSIYKDQSNTWE